MRIFSKQPNRFTAFAILLAASSTAHILLRTSTHGAAIGPDAVSYVSTAANLIDGHGLQDFRGTGLFAWPPLFPALVAAVQVVGLGPLEAGRLLNATAYGLIILVSALWAGRTLESSLLAYGVAVFLATSIPLSHHASYIQSEPTFILFVLLALVKLEECRRPGARRRTLALAAVFSGLAVLTRYAGAPLILTGVLLLLLRPTPSRSHAVPAQPRTAISLASRVKRAGAYGAASLLPLALWTARNRLLFGDWKRTAASLSNYSWRDLLDQLVQAPRQALGSEGLPEWVAYLPWTVGAALACAGVWVHVRATRSMESTTAAGIGPAFPFAAFGGLYLLFLLAAVSRFSGEGMDQRFLVVAYIPFLLAGVCTLDRFLCLAHGGRLWIRRAILAPAVAIGVGGAVVEIRGNATITMKSLEEGFHARTYNTAYWHELETIRFLKANPTANGVYANRFGALHAVLALQAGANVRGKYLTLPRRRADLTAMADSSETGFDVAWLRFDGDAGYDYDDRTLASMPGVTLLADLSDGAVFRFRGRRELR